ncbi:MAG: hypothetical protein MR601_04780 [Erysipelotrichaceae bacterium]|nr:hypothetical protein [Erysipelotrichaceae bacterium]
MKRKSVRDRSKVERSFYFKLLMAFVITNLIGVLILGYISYRLRKYEEATPTGAIRAYLELVKNKDYDKIYDESKLVFAQFNPKEDYTNYLKSIYENVDLDSATFARQSYSNDEFSYYNIKINNETISTVQLKKDDKLYHVKTLSSVWNFKFDVADNIEFSINEQLVDNGYISETDVKTNAYTNTQDQSNVPNITRYHLDNFVNIPKVVTNNNDYLAVKDFIEDQFYIGKIPINEEKIELEELIQKTAETYSKYITEDETFYNLKKLLNKNTTFYEGISSFYNGWYSSHESVDFLNTEIYDVIKLSDNAFIGTIKYDYQVIAKDKTQNYPTTYQLFFLKENDKWLCTNIISSK